MNQDSVIIIGAGGHGRVLADALLAKNISILGFLDPDQSLWGKTIFGLPVLGGDEVLGTLLPKNLSLVNGIGGVGSTLIRQKVQAKLESRGWKFIGVIHPSAIISSFASIAKDAQILAGSIVQTSVVINKGVIVNSAALVEHDVQVGAWTHCAPGSVICGDVQVGCNCHIGAASVIRQGVLIGDNTLVAMGAVVIRSFEGNATLVGIPASILEHKK